MAVYQTYIRQVENRVRGVVKSNMASIHTAFILFLMRHDHP